MRENVDNLAELCNTPLRKYLIRRSDGALPAASFDAEDLAQTERKSICKIIYQIPKPSAWENGSILRAPLSFHWGVG